jgi:tRNA modification GTPase
VQRPAIVVENKVDVLSAEFSASSSQSSVPSSQLREVRTSAVTGEGIAEVRGEILRHVGGEASGSQESGFLTNMRHQGRVQESITALDAAAAAVQKNIPHEMVLLDLYNGLRALDEITGATTTDDILNLIFSSFCIGK